MAMADAQGAVQTLLDDLVNTDVERWLQVAAYHDGELVVDAWAGVADPLTGQTVDGDTLFTVFSVTKGITATAIHLLAERGQLGYDDPIAMYWPEFAAHGKGQITIRQVLSHTAGIPQTPLNVALTDWEGMCRAIAEMTPLWEPGTQMGYHAMNFGTILGEVARRVDGRGIARIVAEDLNAPLGITALFFGIPDEAERRVATLENDASITNAPDPPPDSLVTPENRDGYATYNRPEVRRAVLPAGGGITNARSLARHYASLIGEGVDGVRLLPTERVQIATTLEIDARDAVLRVPMRRGLGYMLGGHGLPMGGRVSAFGHRGYGGAIGFADPEYGFAFALTKNRLAFSRPTESTADKVAQAVRHALGIPEAS